jgi:hypothetical protein
VALRRYFCILDFENDLIPPVYHYLIRMAARDTVAERELKSSAHTPNATSL